MMEPIQFSERLLPAKQRRSAIQFLQWMANRMCVGQVRYGPPSPEKKYQTRLFLELKTYKRTGNLEHLLNAAVYCWLEPEAPENKKFHFDPDVDSVTRGKV